MNPLLPLLPGPPGDEAVTRQALYRGTILRLPANPVTVRFAAEVTDRIEQELGHEGPVREAQFRIGDGEFFERVGRLRKAIYTEPSFHRAVIDVVRSVGFNPARLTFDPARLRVVAHRGFENPAAAPIYYAHRDTWYAHSQAEITWWIPVHAVGEEETFVFYPDWFGRPVPNNSEAFDYDAWTKHGPSLRIGWQDANAGRSHLYPGQVGGFEPGRTVAVAARAGEVVLFSGAHLHQTRHNTTGQTRFSIDFRTVDLADHAGGNAAPNADNRSTGSAMTDYVRGAEFA
jgi:ectoine hydroxylase-related dioxygenase (phytanoyl-CoA dioxygenase family)